MKKWLMTLSMATAMISSVAVAGGDAAAGKAKSAMCAGCHMADGNSVNGMWPKLAGQHESYIIKQLQDFKAGDRVDPTMQPMAAGLSEDDMANLAAFYSSQTLKGGEADPALVEKGKQIFMSGNAASGVAACSACHAPNGVGNPAANFPSLQGQHADYTVKQLKDFRAGNRANDAGKMMQGVAAKMTDDEIAAVASYIQGLN
ncbi:MAG: c-type cytochrome [Gammaproteobacteria bacterium]|jgi:cytochrome c553